MTDETTQGTPAPAADPNAPVVQPQAIYIKDCSFESPNGPFLATAQGNPSPSVNLNLGTRATALAQDLHEVVLQVNLEAKAGDRTVWLLELQQAGAFTIRNLSASGRGPGPVDHGAELPHGVRARDHLRSRDQGRFPAVPAAARDLRGAACTGRAAGDSRSRK